MCDTFVALADCTVGDAVLFAKSADCEANEAIHLLRTPARRHESGEVVRLTHLVIPQAAHTHEVLMSKAFWTYGCEAGINDRGLAVGEEAVYTTEMHEGDDGIIGPDLVRLALERAANCTEAIEVVASLLERYGQGGNGELKGNSHFDSSFLISDRCSSFILETAGRNWVAKEVDGFASISNILGIETEWDLASWKSDRAGLNWARTYGLAEVPPSLGAPLRQSVSNGLLAKSSGHICARTMFEILRHHGEGFDPAGDPVHSNICVHVGPQRERWWQADCAIVTQIDRSGEIVWVTGTSGTCLSIFKPVFLGVALPDVGPAPSERFDPETVWWKHELLHRRAMLDFHATMPEIRKEFDSVESSFLDEVGSVQSGSPEMKREFMRHCFQVAGEATDQWIARLGGGSRPQCKNQEYGAMWERLNAEAGIPK